MIEEDFNNSIMDFMFVEELMSIDPVVALLIHMISWCAMNLLAFYLLIKLPNLCGERNGYISTNE